MTTKKTDFGFLDGHLRNIAQLLVKLVENMIFEYSFKPCDSIATPLTRPSKRVRRLVDYILEKSVSCQKKDGCGHTRPSFFWHDNDKGIKVCFLVMRVIYCPKIGLIYIKDGDKPKKN